MIIPNKIRIGDTQYLVKEKNWFFNETLGGQINYNNKTVAIRKSLDKMDKEGNFFHELAHGILKEMEFNYPKIVAFKNNEDFVHEFGLTLRKTFLDLLDKQSAKLGRHGKLLERTRFDKNDIVELETHYKMFLYSKGIKKGYCLFDKQDLDLVKNYNWQLDKDNYVVVKINNKRVLMHRLILNYFGKDEIDHKNHIKFDNRRKNIRICSRLQNSQNKLDAKGVSIKKEVKYKKYRAYITVNKKRIELGTFYTEEEAQKVRDEAVKKYFGEFAPIKENPKIALEDFRRLF